MGNGNRLSDGWPTSPLAAAGMAFDALVAPPATLVVDGRKVGHGLPPRGVPLDELRALLLARGCPPATRDACWHLLIGYARSWGPAWVVGTVGMALPGLVRMAGRLCAGYGHVAEDIEAELLAGFLHGLRHGDLSGPAPYARLCWMGWRAALAARTGETTAVLPELPDPASGTPARPYGHPDLILARAVAAGWITGEQAELISVTRLGGVLIDQLAAQRQVSAAVLRMRRRRGEWVLVEALRRGHLDPARPVRKSPRRRGHRAAGDATGRPAAGSDSSDRPAAAAAVSAGQVPAVAGQVRFAFARPDNPGLGGA